MLGIPNHRFRRFYNNLGKTVAEDTIKLYEYAAMHTVKAVDILDIGTVYQTAITMTTPVLMVYRVGNVS